MFGNGILAVIQKEYFHSSIKLKAIYFGVMKRQCQECGHELKGRADQRFCSDMCRNAHHNEIRREENNLLRRINARLSKNRRILEAFFSSGMDRIKRDELLRSGFDFGYFTGLIQTEDGLFIHLCYDQAYCEEGDGWYSLMKAESV